MLFHDASQYFTGGFTSGLAVQPRQLLTSTLHLASTWSLHRSHLGCPSDVVRARRMTSWM
jgi:hypothetical protein